MKIESRILSSIKHRPGMVVLRRDFANLGSPSQVSEALNSLQAAGVIARVSPGVYAKTIKDSATGAVTFAARAEDIACEAFGKLGFDVQIVNDGGDGSEHNLLVDAGDHRLRRHLSIGGKRVTYFRRSPRKNQFVLTTPLEMPAEGVSEFVKALARKFNVTYSRTAGDVWAEAVTRLAGDEVRSDDTSDLLVALKRANKVTDREMATLLINHRREIRRV
jgi:hypothetical protein